VVSTDRRDAGLGHVDGHGFDGGLGLLDALPERIESLGALALAVAHAHSVVHRDLKPENIMLWTPLGLTPTTAEQDQQPYDDEDGRGAHDGFLLYSEIPVGRSATKG
jgi:hypothetical protein